VLSIYIFAFEVHGSILPLYEELHERSPSKMMILTSIGMGIVLVFYTIVSVLGYLTIADHPGLNENPAIDNILNLFPKDDISAIVGKFIVSIVIILSFPLIWDLFLAPPRVYIHTNSTSHTHQENECKCMNGGRCMKIGVDIMGCSCQFPYSGDKCDNSSNPVAPCFSSPCYNGGTCFQRSSSFLCVCTKQFKGTQCQDKQ